MPNTQAKELLAQADRLMRQKRTPEELPVLTDLVVDEIAIPALDESTQSYGRKYSGEPIAQRAANPPATTAVRPTLPESVAARPASSANPVAAAPLVASAAAMREQFNASLLAKLEEMQHGVYSQVMQQLELHAGGSLKTKLRETLEPALIDIARDIAEQVAEDTSAQIREVVSQAVDAEIARLREQLAKRRS